MLDQIDWFYIGLILGCFLIFGAFAAGIACFTIAAINLIASIIAA